jgi:4-diphosphocytidyl-2-C-methyl-D-erythritol kinase
MGQRKTRASSGGHGARQAGQAMSMKALFDVPAPAKLNLFLHITGQRADGYHLLQSVFMLIDWCDTLHFERRSDGQISRHDLTTALPADDLCLRAARLLQAESATDLGADISIAKHVPWGAGMGGGSSDAASTLLALNRLWGLHWPLPKLLALGLKLGADVPFFLGGHNAWVEGIGEKLTAVNLPSRKFAVVKPAASLETRVVFGDPALVRNTPAATIEGFAEHSKAADKQDKRLLEFGHNDLQPVAEKHCAQVSHAAQALQSVFGHSRMTGSGSAVFAEFGEKRGGRSFELENSAFLAAASLLPRTWVTRMCSNLPQHPLAAWSTPTAS